MKSENGNRVADVDLHNELLGIEPWGSVRDGDFVGEIVFGEEFSTDDINVSVYSFKVADLLDHYIGNNQMGQEGHLHPDAVKGAKIIIADLKGMIAEIEQRIPDEVRDIPISSLSLSKSMTDILVAGGFNTLSELQNSTDEKLMSCEGIGRSAMRTIRMIVDAAT